MLLLQELLYLPLAGPPRKRLSQEQEEGWLVVQEREREKIKLREERQAKESKSCRILECPQLKKVQFVLYLILQTKQSAENSRVAVSRSLIASQPSTMTTHARDDSAPQETNTSAQPELDKDGDEVTMDKKHQSSKEKTD